MSASGKTPAASAARNQAIAAIRNTIIGILHLHRMPNIAAQLRICHRDPYRLRSSPSASPCLRCR